MKTILHMVLWVGLLAGICHGQNVGIVRQGTNIVTGTNAPTVAWSNANRMPALKLSATNGTATIATNEPGIGWDADGRLTVVTPVGLLQFYETGSPSTPTIYFPGTLVAQRISSVFLDSQVYASNIVGGVAGGNIGDAIMQASMPAILSNWQPGGAQAAGWPHVMTNAALWPTSGTYVPVGVVTNFATDNISGEYWSLAKLLTNAFNEGGFIPTGAAAAGDPIVANGTGGHVVQAARTVRRQTTNDFSKTNWATAGINSSTNLATSPFPTWSIEGGVTYHLRYVCWWASDSTNAGLNFGVVFSNHLTPIPQNVGFGRTFGGSEVGFNSTTNSTDMWFMFPTVINGGSQSNRVVSGYMTFYAQSNTTMTFSWAPANNVTNVQTLKAGSTITLEKIAP